MSGLTFDQVLNDLEAEVLGGGCTAPGCAAPRERWIAVGTDEPAGYTVQVYPVCLPHLPALWDYLDCSRCAPDVHRASEEAGRDPAAVLAGLAVAMVEQNLPRVAVSQSGWERRHVYTYRGTAWV